MTCLTTVACGSESSERRTVHIDAEINEPSVLQAGKRDNEDAVLAALGAEWGGAARYAPSKSLR